MHELLHNMEWVEGVRSVYLTPIFSLLSALGSSTFLLSFLVFGFLAINKTVFARAIAIVLVSAIINDWLKNYFQDPRPLGVLSLDPRVAGSFGFPSGHTQVAVALWLWLAYHARQRWGAVGLVTLAAGVAVSRLYLGVHDLEDVLGGAALGFGILGVFVLWSADRFSDARQRYSALPLLAAVVLTLVSVATWPGADVRNPILFGGLLCAFWFGYRIEGGRLQLERTSAVRSGLAGTLGVVGMLAVLTLVGGSRNGPPLEVLPAAFLVGLYISVLAPLLVVRLGLLRREKGEAGESSL